MTGIIILNYKKYDVTINCVESVLKTAGNLDYKIYLVDNGSGNESVSVLSDKYGGFNQIEIISLEENTGYAAGNNEGLKKAAKDGCSTAIIANSDIVFYEDTIKILVNDIENGAFIAAPKLVFPNGKTQSSVKQRPFNFLEYIFYETYFRNFVPKSKLKEIRLLPDKPSSVYWVSGAVFAVNVADFKKEGFFDPFTFLYFEEYILAEKAKKSGSKILFDPTACAIHCHGASSGGNANLFTRTENLRSEMYFLNRYLHWSKFKIKAVRFVRCLEVLFTFSKEGKKKEAERFIKQSKELLKKELSHEN